MLSKRRLAMGKINKDTNEPNPPKEKDDKPSDDKRSHGEDVTSETHRKTNTGGNGARRW